MSNQKKVPTINNTNSMNFKDGFSSIINATKSKSKIPVKKDTSSKNNS